jgi:hypothetical protein
MTSEDLDRIHLDMHNLRLGGRAEPVAEALASQTGELLDEIRRLRSLVIETASYLKDHDRQKAEQLEARVDSRSKSPV